MQSSHLKKQSFPYFVLCWCFAAFVVVALKAEEQEQSAVGTVIDEFILADEFKATEREKLRLLPVETVELLTERLNHLESDSPGELRIFECLVIKVMQFESVLTPTGKAAALAALKAKMTNENSQFHSHRLRLYESASTSTSRTEERAPKRSAPLPNSPSVLQLPAPNKTPDAKSTPTRSSEPTSSKPVSIIVGLITVAIGLLWLLVKKRK